MALNPCSSTARAFRSASAAPHELPDGVAHVRVVAAQAIHPADHERVAGPEQIKEPATFWTIRKARPLVYFNPYGRALRTLVARPLGHGQADRARVGLFPCPHRLFQVCGQGPMRTGGLRTVEEEPQKGAFSPASLG